MTRQDLTPCLAAPELRSSQWPRPSLHILCMSSPLTLVQTQLTSVYSLNWSLACGAEAGWCLGVEWSVWNSNVFYYLAHG